MALSTLKLVEAIVIVFISSQINWAEISFYVQQGYTTLEKHDSDLESDEGKMMHHSCLNVCEEAHSWTLNC